jgi:hypothetical protein
MHSFLIITPFRNAERFIAESAARSLSQVYSNYRIVFVDDASTDSSLSVLQQVIDRHREQTRCQEVVVESVTESLGPLENTHNAILNHGHADDIIVTVDGDDWLLHKDVLTVIDAVYQRDHCWLTYGGAIWNPPDAQTFRTGAYTQAEVAELRDPRPGEHWWLTKWKIHHLRTFRCALYRKLGELDPDWSCLKDAHGRFYRAAGDVAMMLPLVELVGADRLTHVQANLYVYNVHSHNEHVIDWQLQARNANDSFAKPGFSRIPKLSGRSSIDRVAPVFLRSTRAAVGTDTHVSGWPYARQLLNSLRLPSSIVLDDFVEQTYGYGHRPPRIQRPWMGIFHHPPNMPECAIPDHRPEKIFEMESWRQNANFLVGGIALSDYLATYLREILRIPIITVRHPCREPAQGWDSHRFKATDKKNLLQVGYYLRNTRAIHQIPPCSGYHKIRLFPPLPWAERYESRVINYWQRRKSRMEYGQVTERGRVSMESYDQLLTSAVVLTELFDASATNVVLDCLVRNTPLAINRHPAVIEYLGADYPLYFNNLAEVPQLLDEDRVLDAHRYLRSLCKENLAGDYFIRSVTRGIEKFLSDSQVAHRVPAE